MEKHRRIPRDEYFMRLAILTSLRGTCTRGQVGCILVTDDNRIVSTGYNSSYPGTPHCDDMGCLLHEGHCIRCLHAEQAACLKLDIRHESLKSFQTLSPCIHCYKVMINSGVKEIYYLNKYWDDPPAMAKLQDETGIIPQQILKGVDLEWPI